jgi:putative transposase
MLSYGRLPFQPRRAAEGRSKPRGPYRKAEDAELLLAIRRPVNQRQPTAIGGSLDAFDREIIAWTAVANAGISGSDVRDMMLEAVEKRFGATRASHAIEHLSDNGSAYIARETRLFAQALNLTPCFTPVASPQSNGMSEAFVKTLKRDYIRISALPDAETARRLIHGWIEDYNEIHPHSALKMASPKTVHQG